MDKSNLPDACFNSTLVQLKAVPVFPSCRWFPSFNSTLVQLKVGLLFNLFSSLWCFNSTLVQLKEIPPFNTRMICCCFNSTLVQLKAVKNANKYTSKSMIYHPFILIFYKHLQSTFNS